MDLVVVFLVLGALILCVVFFLLIHQAGQIDELKRLTSQQEETLRTYTQVVDKLEKKAGLAHFVNKRGLVYFNDEFIGAQIDRESKSIKPTPRPGQTLTEGKRPDGFVHLPLNRRPW